MASIFDHIASGGDPSTYDPAATAPVAALGAMPAADPPPYSGPSGSTGLDRTVAAIPAYLAHVAQGVGSAIALPRDVMQGSVDPMSDEGIARTNALAGMMMGGPEGAEMTAARSVETGDVLASKGVSMYNPPSKAPRAFGEDYPSGAPADEAGNLTHDIEGRPLNPGALVVGRRVVGGDDQGLTAPGLQLIAEVGTGRPVQATTPGTGILGRNDAGAVERVSGTNVPRQVFLSNKLTAGQAPLVLGHEVGHIVDMLADTVPQTGLKNELSAVYNDLNNPQSYGKPFGPQNAGYKGADVPPEYMAEAVRAYMADPNYLKTVAPKTAAAIREAVNGNPRLNGTVQFNAGSLLTSAASNALTSAGAPAPTPTQFNALLAAGGAT